MIDFSKLERPSSEKRERNEKARRDREITEDLARRTERARKVITITCTEDADQYFTRSGSCYLSIHGIQPDGRPISASWYAPDHSTDEDINSTLAPLVRGATVELRGYWKPHKNRDDKTCFTFMAQFIQTIAPTEERRPQTSPEDQMKAFG
jgi:hypothetical protein